jgi:release factor glutamine methyltransferase
MTLGEALREGAARLAAAGIEMPQREARWLMGLALDLPDGTPLDGSRAIDPASFNALVARRCAREPLAFLFGTQEFAGMELEVSPATLIPRLDSETLIEAAIAACPDPRSVLDLGTGTGALLLAALRAFPAAWGLGVDRIPAAAALAARNAARTGLADRAAFLCADWAAALAGRFDLVLCNPPYIETAAIPGLMPEVACYEPGSALDGGADGLDCYRLLIPLLPGLLAPGGVAVLELGAGQAADARALAADFTADLRADGGGIPRALVLRVKKPIGTAGLCG